jgi:2-polyprenyl-6-methoxyphenol hydroxylase-like FAD-dependent oxidoreductase
MRGPPTPGAGFIEIGIPDVDRVHPEIGRFVGRGSLFALADHKGLIAQRNGDGRIRVYVALRMPEDSFADLGIAFDDPAETRAAVLRQFDGWAPGLLHLIQACDDSFVPRTIRALPVGVAWPCRPGLTLLGDAAHLMSPFAGAGANIAMQDGAALAEALLQTEDTSTAIRSYEAAMFRRAEQAARDSNEGLEMCISSDGSHRMAARFHQFRGPDA